MCSDMLEDRMIYGAVQVLFVCTLLCVKVYTCIGCIQQRNVSSFNIQEKECLHSSVKFYM
jgi:hypothetical protein